MEVKEEKVKQEVNRIVEKVLGKDFILKKVDNLETLSILDLPFYFFNIVIESKKNSKYIFFKTIEKFFKELKEIGIVYLKLVIEGEIFEFSNEIKKDVLSKMEVKKGQEVQLSISITIP